MKQLIEFIKENIIDSNKKSAIFTLEPIPKNISNKI